MNNTVMVVDDETVLAGAMRDYLGRHGYAVQVKSSGEEALKTIELEPPDIVVLDYRLPRMDGLELIGRLRKSTPELPIVLVSGYVDTMGMNEASTGADVVIQKSANEVSHLVRSVNRLLRRKSLQEFSKVHDGLDFS